MAQFRVVLDGVDLSDEQHQSLNRALQGTTLAFLADLDSKGDRAAFYLPKIIRPPLAGIWIRELDERQFERINESIELGSRVEELNQEIIESGQF